MITNRLFYAILFMLSSDLIKMYPGAEFTFRSYTTEDYI